MENTESKKNNFEKILVVVCIVLALFGLAYYYRGYIVKKQNIGAVSSSFATSSTVSFSPNINNAIEKFIFTRISALSPIPAATGADFTVSSVEHTGPGETLVIYSDSTVTYTARGRFELVDSKKLDILEFDIVSSSTPSQHWDDEALQLAADYIRAHVSELSPEKEVLGGKFYITNIVFENSGNALVDYEDGHIALRAHVSFMVDGGKNVEVLEWKMIPVK